MANEKCEGSVDIYKPFARSSVVDSGRRRRLNGAHVFGDLEVHRVHQVVDLEARVVRRVGHVEIEFTTWRRFIGWI